MHSTSASASTLTLPGAGRPATPQQLAAITRLRGKLGPYEFEDSYDAAALALGITYTLGPGDPDDPDRPGDTYTAGDGDALAAAVSAEGLTSHVASALITALRDTTSEPWASCFCGQRREKRGKPCQVVTYYHDGYDRVTGYACGVMKLHERSAGTSSAELDTPIEARDYGYEDVPERPAYERETLLWVGDDEGWGPT